MFAQHFIRLNKMNHSSVNSTFRISSMMGRYDSMMSVMAMIMR